MSLKHRYDFVYLFDVQDGNPNGDPDGGNMPRMDDLTGQGLVTDVCLKRKIRNYVAIRHAYAKPHDIYVREGTVLADAHFAVFDGLGIDVGQEGKAEVTAEVMEAIREADPPDDLVLHEEGDELLVKVPAAADQKEITEWLKSLGKNWNNDAKKAVNAALRGAVSRTPTPAERQTGRGAFCRDYFDIRAFGAVLSLKSAPNCGQVRGPIQLTFARSQHPISTKPHTLTRVAVTTKEESAKQQGENRTMGRKHTVSYGLYRAHGFVSAFLSHEGPSGTGFSEGDLDLLWEALQNMFEHDRSAARGLMIPRGLYVFEHADILGNAPAHTLFERLTVDGPQATNEPAKAFADYRITFDGTPMAVGESKRATPGVTLTRRC